MSGTALVVVRPGGIGDTLLLSPALSQVLRVHGRHLPIHLVGYSDRLGLIQQAGLADHLHSLDTWLYSPQKVLNYSRQAVKVVSFFSQLPVGLPANWEVVPWPPLPDLSSQEPHLVVKYIADCLGVELPSPSAVLQALLSTDRAWWPTRLWVHPGAGGISKRYPIDRWLVVWHELPRRIGYRTSSDPQSSEVVFVLGEADQDLLPRLRSAGVACWIPENLNDLISQFRTNQQYIGNDTGPTHLAALVGMPTTIVYGTRINQPWLPWGPAVSVLGPQTGSCWPTAEEVLNHLIAQRNLES